ncbi:MAG TPA: DUF4389 domain-containing protein [Solirubrobacteraceae bacterium]|jgi:hypothetical protein|nr:DUF4389 domain-containing protein [Solirubrobacteraceae bacterium]
MSTDHPVKFSVDYPERRLNRVTSAFRMFTAIPILIVLASIGGFSARYGASGSARTVAAGGSGLLFLPPLLLIVFRQRYPRWWFDWNQQLLRFSNRIGVYLALMDDRYPSTDEQQAVHLDFDYPDAGRDLNRWLPLVKWLLAIPHYVLLFFLYIGAFFAVIIAWIAILFTGRYPRGIFDYVEGVIRWHNRVVGYALILVTDQYPPFRLRP